MLRRPRLLRRFRAVVRSDPAGVGAGFVALLLSSGGDLLAGLTLGSITGTLQELPGLLVLVPAAIGRRATWSRCRACSLPPTSWGFGGSRRRWRGRVPPRVWSRWWSASALGFPSPGASCASRCRS